MFCDLGQSWEAEVSESINKAEGRIGSAELLHKLSINHSANLEIVSSGGDTSYKWRIVPGVRNQTHVTLFSFV